MLNPPPFPRIRVRMWAIVNACVLVLCLFLPMFPQQWTMEGFAPPTTLIELAGTLMLLPLFFFSVMSIFFIFVGIICFGAMAVVFWQQLVFVYDPADARPTPLQWLALIGGGFAFLGTIVALRLDLLPTIAVLVAVFCSCGLLNVLVNPQDRQPF